MAIKVEVLSTIPVRNLESLVQGAVECLPVEHLRGFARIRHYGLLGNRKRAAKLAACRLQLGALMPAAAPAAAVVPCAIPDDRCPACRAGRLVRRQLTVARLPPELADTS